MKMIRYKDEKKEDKKMRYRSLLLEKLCTLMFSGYIDIY
jgi:hypothetical protein